MWRLWGKALGEKASGNNKEADKVAIISTFIFLSYMITTIAIIANAVRHWNYGTERLVELDQSKQEQLNRR